MKIEQRFTSVGKLGVWLVFLGPILAGYSYWSLWSAVVSRTPGFDPMPYLVLTIIGSFLSLASFPMMIIGRDFEGKSTKEPVDNGMWR